MRKYITFLCCLIVSATLSQNNYQNNRFCGFDTKSGFNNTVRRSFYSKTVARSDDKSGIPEVVEKIEKVLKFDVPILIYIAQEEDNCFASIDADGNRILIADYQFLVTVNKTVGTEWAAISVLAHEVGHHIAKMGRHENQVDDELDADYWCGQILQRLGASINASIRCIMKYGSDKPTKTHPDKNTRIEMIKKGWKDAADKVIDYTKCDDCKL